MSSLPHSPAADRNKEPILAVLRELLGSRGSALEIAAGTGQHAAWFAAALPGWKWLPSEADASMLPAIAARIAEAGLSNVREPVLLDVAAPQWPTPQAPFTERFDLIYCANMLHIAPWSACAGLMAGAARQLAAGGRLVTYGPYFEAGQAPVPSNVAFDESLRARNPEWGIRQLDAVAAQAARSGLALQQRHAMPANNLLLVFTAAAAARPAAR
ncbi:MAG TPA: DUF938 domain-containing protein, partial [Ramlibacter sp.]